jgi:hypothetical protein
MDLVSKIYRQIQLKENFYSQLMIFNSYLTMNFLFEPLFILEIYPLAYLDLEGQIEFSEENITWLLI